MFYSELVPQLEALSKQGTPRQAKHAIICIKNVCKDKDAVLTDIVEVRLYSNWAFLIWLQFVFDFDHWSIELNM